MSTREKILSAKATKSKLVTLGEPISASVEVRSMSVGDKLDIVSQYRAEGGGLDAKAALPKLLVGSCFEPGSDERVFEPTDGESILKQDYAALEPLLDAVLELNGFSSAETAAKNSDPTPTSSSRSE